MSLVPEKKSIENEYRKFAAIILFVLGCVLLTWFFFHLIYCAIYGIAFDFVTILSLGRLILGFLFTIIGFVMYKFIDWEYNKPAPRK